MASTETFFRNSVLLSGLASEAELDAADEALRESLGVDARGEITDEQLAGKLIEGNLLTAYQADQMMAGRTRFNLGPYVITDWIGQGGMGQVFKAVHQMLNREVAVKVLPLSRSTPDSIDKFTREIRMQAQLDHPNLVRAYDAGKDGNVHYLVTEYVPGTDLRRLIRSRGPLDMEQAATVILQAARGLEHAHQSGLVHRDVKPGNLLVTPTGITKVSDLGLSGFLHEGKDDPRRGKIVGTADYISPEVVKTPGEMSAASDVYSLGCTLYYALTGKVPFPGGSTRDKLKRHCEETPWHPRRFNVDVSEELVEVIADMMEKDPTDRIQTAGEVIARLEPWAADEGPRYAEQLTKSPWMLPPLPTGGEADEGDMQDTDPGSHDPLYVTDPESASHVSQATDPINAAIEDTKRLPRSRRRAQPPPIPQPERRSRPRRGVRFALAVAIPVSLLVGAVATFVLLWSLWW